MKNKIDCKAFSEFISTCSPETKIYIGCDSTRFKKNDQHLVNYACVVVVHKNGNNGCKIFGEISTEKDYTLKNKGSHKYRLMQEVYKASELYLRLFDIISEYEVELHLDLNKNPKYASNEVVQQAIGYIKASCVITPKIKPEAWAASYAADRLSGIN